MRILMAAVVAFAGAGLMADAADAQNKRRGAKAKPPTSYQYAAPYASYQGYRASKSSEEQAECERADSVDPTRQYNLPCWARWALSPKTYND